MKKRKIKKNLFLMLICSAAKGATTCILSLLLLGILENVSLRKKLAAKNKMFKVGAKSKSSIEDKISKWR